MAAQISPAADLFLPSLSLRMTMCGLKATLQSVCKRANETPARNEPDLLLEAAFLFLPRLWRPSNPDAQNSRALPASVSGAAAAPGGSVSPSGATGLVLWLSCCAAPRGGFISCFFLLHLGI